MGTHPRLSGAAILSVRSSLPGGRELHLRNLLPRLTYVKFMEALRGTFAWLGILWEFGRRGPRVSSSFAPQT